MKKHVLSAVIFMIGLALLLLLAGLVFMPKSNTKEAGIIDAAANGILGEPENTVDTLFLGDSLAYSAFIPMHIWEETGSTSYVCSTGEQQLQYTSELLKKAFTRQSPKTVFLEANVIYRKVNLGTVIYTKLYDAFSVFRYHDRWKDLSVQDLTRRKNYSWTDDEKGFRYFTDVRAAEETDYMAGDEYASAEIPDLNRALLGELADACAEHGAELVIISVPSMKNWSRAKHNGVRALAEEIGVEYVDLNAPGTLTIDWQTDTRDKGDHMSYAGALKVTDYVIGYLSEKDALTDHRADPAFAPWHEAFARVKAKNAQ